MVKLLQSLVLLFSLSTFASAIATPTLPDPTKRQTNRKKIIAREALKRASGVISVVAEHNDKGPWQWGHQHHWPHPSGHSYPQCDVDCGWPGLARYKNWDLLHDDLPGNPVNIGEWGNEETCLQKCWEKSWKGDWQKACVGVEYTPNDSYGHCYLKGLQVDKGNFTNKDYGAKQKDTYLALIGGCAAWAPYVPKEMDKICCNSW